MVDALVLATKVLKEIIMDFEADMFLYRISNYLIKNDIKSDVNNLVDWVVSTDVLIN